MQKPSRDADGLPASVSSVFDGEHAAAHGRFQRRRTVRDWRCVRREKNLARQGVFEGEGKRGGISLNSVSNQVWSNTLDGSVAQFEYYGTSRGMW